MGGNSMWDDGEKLFTSAGTDINEVKRKNAASGLSYREVLQMLARNNSQNPNNNLNNEEYKQRISSSKARQVLNIKRKLSLKH